MTAIDPAISPAAGNASEPSPRRAMAWGLIGLIVFLFAAAIGGGWWWLHRPIGNAPSDAGPMISVVMDTPPGMGRGGRGARPNIGGLNRFIRRFANGSGNSPPDGIVPTATGYLVRAGNTHLDVMPLKAEGQWQYRFFYVNETLGSADDLKMVQVMLRTHDADLAAKAGVTDDQKQKLKKIPPGGMIVDATERAQIAALFTVWLTAAGRDGKAAASNSGAAPPPVSAAAKPAETALVSALALIGQKQLPPSRQNTTDRAKQIHDILGDATIAKLQ